MDREAVTAPIAMIVALTVFISVFAALSMRAGDVGDGDAAQASDVAHLRAQSENLLDLMLQSTGYSYQGSAAVDWISPEGETGREDAVQRLGLRQSSSSGLDFDKFENLRRAPYAADGTDGYVNYEEARSALDYDKERLGFHVRAKPVLPSVQEILDNGVRDPTLRVTYIAAAETSGVSGGIVLQDAECRADTASTHELAVTIHNGANHAVQLNAFVTLTAVDGTTRSEWINGPVFAALTSQEITSSLPADADLCGDGATMDVEVWDVTQSLVQDTYTRSDPAPAGASPYDVVLDTGTSYTIVNDVATFSYSGADLPDDEELRFTIGTGSTTFTAGAPTERDVLAGPGADGDRHLDTGPLTPGTYLASLHRVSDGALLATENLVVVSTAPDDIDLGAPTITSGGVAEVGYLNDLVERFCPFHHDTGGAILGPDPTHAERCGFPAAVDQGDVLLDTKKVMDNDLPTRLLDGNGDATLDHVRVLVVGSNVDHHSMTSAHAKHAVRDWVLAGGTLVVYGSTEQAVQWLQPIFHSGIESSSGGISTPDASHPLLHVSDDLDYLHYSDHGHAWSLKSTEKFADVVKDGDDAALLTISDPGAYGDGTIILTSWLPHDIYGDGVAGPEGARLTNNLLMQGYRGLFLDYGPPIPDGQYVVPAVGRAQIFHPELERLVSLDISLFVFEQG